MTRSKTKPSGDKPSSEHHPVDADAVRDGLTNL